MPSSRPGPSIRLRGVRQNNLKGFDLDLPLRRLIVITGPSGSGKSSLAFETLFAEGQRRYIETFSPYARQFFDRMDKPRVDAIEGIPPAIAIEQRNTVRTTRSTVGTMTELCDYLKLVWPQLAALHCRQCGRPVVPEPPAVIWAAVPRDVDALLTFELPLSSKLSLEASLQLVAGQGYQRLWIDGDAVRLKDAPARLVGATALTVVQDRVRTAASNRARFAEACEQAYHFGKGRLTVSWATPNGRESRRFSRGRHCAPCGLEYREPSPALFSFNHPLGACPTCRGFGRTITIDYERALPDRSRTLAGGVVRPWQSGVSQDCQRDLLRFCRAQEIPVNVPFRDLPAATQQWVIQGDSDYGIDDEHEWPRAWYGVKGYFRWLETKAYKMHVRVLLSRYRAYVTCPTCGGQRLQPEALLYRAPGPPAEAGLSLAGFYRLTVSDALPVVEQWRAACRSRLDRALDPVLDEVRSRLRYLEDVGLGYLTLDRPTRSLSGGETERVNLTTCLGTHLVNTLYVLDEPSVGLHARDTARLVRILEQLRDLGNTVVVVEHEASVMRAADQIVDLGPGHGEAGGAVVFQGTLAQLRRSRASLTGRYLSGRSRMPGSRGRPSVPGQDTPCLRLRGATRHNLRGLEVAIPLGRLVCVSGVSGSGKSTLIRDVLHPLLAERFQAAAGVAVPAADAEAGGEGPEPDETTGTVGRLEGAEALGHAVLVDQSPIGRTPRSNPAVYLGAFDAIRALFADSEAARQRGLSASAFSFNSAQGQCDRCRGAGFEKIEMQFLSDVFIRCPACAGRRYRGHVLEVRLSPDTPSNPRKRQAPPGWSIADVLEATVDEARTWLGRFPTAAARRAADALRWLQEVGLGYLRLGQPINTLSGGESQRLKLVGHLAEFARVAGEKPAPALFLLDEPTTGLHFDDVRVLLEAFQRLVEAGHSVVVIEHNLDVLRAADWIIDLGPEAGEGGGRIVVEGPPAVVMACATSHTGQALSSNGTAQSEAVRRSRGSTGRVPVQSG